MSEGYMAYQAHYGDTNNYTPTAPSAGPAAGGQQGHGDRAGLDLMEKVKEGFHMAVGMAGDFDIKAVREELEGPKPLRVLAGLGGLALAISSAFGLLNIFAVIFQPAKFLLQFYEMLFGILIMIVEMKAFFKDGHPMREFAYKWFPFLTVVGGKGLFYIFTGSLGMGFGFTNILAVIPSIFVAAMGVIYCLIHIGKCKQMEEKYDKTIMITHQGM